MRSAQPEHGVEFLEAWFHGQAYHKHRHDTYGICLTTAGVQAFDYRGSAEVSAPGQVTVLHPDELHDGHAGTEEGFGYRMLYVEPALIFEAVQAICGRACSLPFVRAPGRGEQPVSQAEQMSSRPEWSLRLKFIDDRRRVRAAVGECRRCRARSEKKITAQDAQQIQREPDKVLRVFVTDCFGMVNKEARGQAPRL
jgi:hypothetical protein